jgi:hypothetical protein
MDDTVKENLKDSSTWMRLLYMLIFVIIFNIGELLVGALVIFQLLVKLFTGETNDRLRDFGQQLSQYLYRILQFLTFNSEDKPFPFDDWEHGNRLEPPTSD